MVLTGGHRDNHAFYLNDLLAHMQYIGENPYSVVWVMHEGIWTPSGTTRKNSLCDIILGHEDMTITLGELKSSPKKRTKAIRQLKSGADFVAQYFPNYTVTSKKFIWHDDRRKPPYNYEIIA